MTDVAHSGRLRSPLAYGAWRDEANSLLGAVLVGGVSVVILAPVFFILAHSFNVAAIGEPFRFGLDGWIDLVTSPNTISSIGYSFLLTVRVPIAIVFAFGIAWSLVRLDIPGRRFIAYALWFTYFLPAVPMTMGWILLLDENYGVINQLLRRLFFLSEPVFSIYSVMGILWVHITLSTIPVMVILLEPAIRQLDMRAEEAAVMSGASRLRTLRRVTLPLIAPTVAVTLIAGLAKSLELFEIERLLGIPARIYVFATRIYDLLTWHPPQHAQGMALGSVLLILMLIMAWAYQKYLNRAGNRPTVTGKGLSGERHPRNWQAWVISAAILLYILIGVALPFAVLVMGSFNKIFGFFEIEDPWTYVHWVEVFTDRNFLDALRNSLLLGLVVGAIGTLLYALLAWVIARQTVRGTKLLSLLIWLPWAIPGILLGSGLLALFLDTPGLSALYGTLFPLGMALIIKEMPIGVQLLRSSLAQVSSELEQAATMTGANFLMTFRRITLPLIAPMLLSVFMLVFSATIRDISTIVLLATPGTQTLSLLMFGFAIANNFEAAAVIGVLIAIMSLIVTWAISRLGMNFGLGR